MNKKTGPIDKFGGYMTKEADFVLEIIFMKTLRIDGYGIQMADEGCNPT